MLPYVKHFFVLFFAIMKMWLNLVFLFVLSSMFEASQARSCNDKNLKSCPKWASNGYCTRSRRFMKRNCKKSCNKCPGKIIIIIVMIHFNMPDKSTNRGACKKSPRFTKQNFCDKCLNEFFVLEIFLETFYVDYQNHN